MIFNVFKTAVAKQFATMQKFPLYRVKVEKDDLWKTYLDSFPVGTNELYRERTEHDCSCCKQFIRAVGDMVAIIDGKIVSIWDVSVPSEPGYQQVADALSALVKSRPIEDVFLHYQQQIGVDKNFEEILGKTKTWEHFFINLPLTYVAKNADIASTIAIPRTKKQVFLRALTEIDQDAVETVLDLIIQGTLYRGAEFKHTIEEFRKQKKAFAKLKTGDEREIFAWTMIRELAEPVARIGNSAIGSLLYELTEGKELDAAVDSYGKKLDPANYKRPKTTLVTKGMVEQAKTKIAELGLMSALERRYATFDDININNILHSNREARKGAQGGDVFDTLAAEAGNKVKMKSLEKVEEVTIDKFLADVLPRSQSIEVLIENRHATNFVSLITACDPTAGQLFKWNNHFSWSYAGELADSDIRKAVAAAGGRVDGAFRFSHSWNHDKRNASLMDLHVFLPANKAKVVPGESHDTYGNDQRVGWNHRTHRASGGVQDVDYTDAAPVGFVPVENITFPDLKRMPEGTYVCKIHNWQLRQPTQGGFKAEIEFGGTVYQYEYDKPLRNKEWVTVAEVTLKDGTFEIKHHLPEATSSKLIWEIPTQEFRKVNTVMLSPNYWDDKAVGNKHFFFMLEGCANDSTARGFYNEFLKEELTPHRKVFEMVGSKTKVADADHQLSGLGFSSTQRNNLICRVKGSFTRVIKIVF